jgi:hypothetical protein
MWTGCFLNKGGEGGDKVYSGDVHSGLLRTTEVDELSCNGEHLLCGTGQHLPAPARLTNLPMPWSGRRGRRLWNTHGSLLVKLFILLLGNLL